jgi:integrase
MANIKYQFKSAIDNSFKEGMDKHSIKRTEGNSDKIYSYAARKNLLNVSADFANYLNTGFTGKDKVRFVKDIEIQHINSYLYSKLGCTQTTINQIVSQLNKLELVCNKKYGLKLDWHTFRNIPQVGKKSVRNAAFSKEQVAQIKEYLADKKDCYGKRAFYVGERWGLRANEIVNLRCKDFNLKNMTLHIDGSGAKGGRSRTLKIEKEDLPLINMLTKGKSENDKIIPIRANSACGYLRNVCQKLGFNDILNAKSSYHALRKYRATAMYHSLLEKGFNESKAQGLVCEFLGHSKSRSDIAEHYILKNMK